MTLPAIVSGFERCGLFMAGVSDHVYADGLAGERLQAARDELSRISTPVDVRLGAELDVEAPGRLGVRPADLPAYDYVFLACTHYQNGNVSKPADFSEPAVAQSMADMMAYAAAQPFADGIVHPFHATGILEHNPSFNLYKAIGLIPDGTIAAIARDMRRNRIAFELHTSLLEEDYAAAMERVIAIVRRERVRFSLGSDAHWLSGIYEIPQIMAYLTRLGVSQGDIWLPGEDWDAAEGCCH